MKTVNRRNTYSRWFFIMLSLVVIISGTFASGYKSSNVAYAADPNIAIGKIASSDIGISTVSSGNDDSIYTEWRADDGNNNHWYKIDLGSSYNLSGTEVMFEASYLMKYKVDVSADDSTWTTVVDKTANTDTSQTQNDPFTSSGKRYVRITITEVPSGVWAGIYEFRIFGVTGGGGSAPGLFSQTSPASGATGVSTTPAFAWGAASGATSYALVVSTSSSYTSPVINQSGLTSTGYTPSTALANNTQYYWKVTATNASGSTVASNAGIAFTTAAAAIPPGSFSLTAPASGATGISTTPAFAWGAASGATSYALVVSTSSSYTSPIINQSGLTSTGYTPSTALANNTQYYWKVTATNASGSTVASNAGIAFTTAAAATSPGAFSLTAPPSGATGVSTTPAFAWGAASGATSYALVVSTSSSYTNPVINQSGLTSTGYTPSTALANNTQYYWKVTATNATGSTVASNAGIAFTTSAAGSGSDANLTSGIYAIDNALGTIKDVQTGTSVTSFLSNVTAASGATVRIYKDNGITEKTGSAVVETENIVKVTAANGTTVKTFTVTTILTTYTYAFNDTFDDAAGNNGLSGWGIPTGGSIVDIGSGNKALQLTGSGYEDSRNGALTKGKVSIEQRISIADTNIVQSIPKLMGFSDTIGELVVQNGQVKIKNGSAYTTVPGGSSITNNAWYTITVQLDTDAQQYTAWVGSPPPSKTWYGLTSNAGVSGISYLIPSSSVNGIKIDYLKMYKSTDTNIPAPPSSIARVVSPNGYYSVTDQGDAGGAITVYTNTTLSKLQAKIAPVKNATYTVPGKSLGTDPIATGNQVVVTSADGSSSRTYAITSTVNNNPYLYSNFDAVTVDNALHQIAGLESDTSVDVFRGIIEPAQNGSYVIKDSNGTTKTTGVILSTDKVIVQAENAAIPPQTYTISLLNDNVAAKFYVEPVNGSDSNNGSIGSPFKTIDKARMAVNAIKNSTNGDIVVYLRGGIYRLTQPLVFSGADSGVNGHTISYKAYSGEQVSISGGELITGWTVDKTVGGNTIYKANAHNLNFSQLYVSGKPATRARFPNEGTYNLVKDWDLTAGTIKINSSELPTFTNSSTNPVVIRVQSRWLDIWSPIQSISTAGSVTTVTPTTPQKNTNANMMPGTQGPGNPYHFENAYELLDVPGEWYLNKDTNTVYYVAAPGQNMSTTEVVAPKLEELVKIAGTLADPVKNLVFSGLTFEHTTWLAPAQYGYEWRTSYTSFPTIVNNGQVQPGWVQAVAKRPLSAVLIQDAQNIKITKSTFRNTGANGLFLRESQNNAIIGNAFYDIGLNGIQAGMFQNYDSDVYNGVDYEKGTPTDTRVIEKDDIISNNYFTRTGSTYLDGMGIYLGWINGTTVEHNEIYNVPYSGIYLGNGKPNVTSILGNLKVRYNNIARNNTMLSDGAAIYGYAKHSPYSLIEGNYLHDGWFSPYEDASNILGLYFDDGSNGYNVIGNLVVNEQGYINGDEAEHIGKGSTFSGNQPTDPAVQENIISNSGLQLPYRAMRLAPAATRYPGKIRVNVNDTQSLKVKFDYAPGWTVYYTTNGIEPTSSSPVANGYLTIPSGTATTYKVVAINDSTGQKSEMISGTFEVETIMYQFGFTGTTPFTKMIEGNTRTVIRQQSTGWTWSAFTPRTATPDTTPPAAGEEWKDADSTVLLDTGTGAHIQFTGRSTGSGVTAGAYAYSIFSSTGSTISDTTLNNLQTTSVEVGSEGGAWPFLPSTQNIAGSPYPMKVRLLMRDANGDWYLSTAATAANIVKSGDFSFSPLNQMSWQKLNTASKAILNGTPSSNASTGAISVDAALVTPNLSSITGIGIYIDTVANDVSYFRFRGMTFIQH